MHHSYLKRTVRDVAPCLIYNGPPNNGAWRAVRLNEDMYHPYDKMAISVCACMCVVDIGVLWKTAECCVFVGRMLGVVRQWDPTR